MQFGRMKGQAFVGLPSERAAIKAVRETNGYVLHGKPMIVVSCDIFLKYLCIGYIVTADFKILQQFARTTKAKDQDK